MRILTGPAIMLALLPLLCTVEASDSDRIRLVRADSLVSLSDDMQEMTELWGDVELMQGTAHLKCDAGRWWEDNNRIILTGHVSIHDGKRTLTARWVDYHGDTGVEKAVGDARLVEENREISADTLTYNQHEERVDAAGHVRISDIIEKADLEAGHVFYERLTGYSRAAENPVLMKVDTVSGDTLHIYGTVMEVWADEERATVTDSIRIRKGPMSARCQYAEYRADQEELLLAVRPVVFHQQHEMSGDTIRVYLEDVHLKGVLLQGQAHVVSSDSIYQDLLEGALITVNAVRDTIREVIVEHQARSFYHIRDEDETVQGANDVTGDRIVMSFGSGKLETVLVESDPGQCTGEYIPETAEGGKKGRGT